MFLWSYRGWFWNSQYHLEQPQLTLLLFMMSFYFHYLVKWTRRRRLREVRCRDLFCGSFSFTLAVSKSCVGVSLTREPILSTLLVLMPESSCERSEIGPLLITPFFQKIETHKCYVTCLKSQKLVSGWARKFNSQHVLLPSKYIFIFLNKLSNVLKVNTMQEN